MSPCFFHDGVTGTSGWNCYEVIIKDRTSSSLIFEHDKGWPI